MSAITRRAMSSSLTAKPSKHHHVAPRGGAIGWPSVAHPFVTDGGLETDLIYRRGIDLREFAAYPLLRTERGRAQLAAYYEGYATIAARAPAGRLRETPPWRAQPHRGAQLGARRRARSPPR